MFMGLEQKYSAKQLLLGGFLLPVVLGLLVGGVALAKAGLTSAPKSNLLGNKNAKVKLVEYSDFQCPFCARLAPTLKQLLADYGDKISVEYRHFPLDFHPMATPAAEASECAAEQKKFWEFHDAVFANQQALSPAFFRSTATSLGLNMKKFDVCVSSGKYSAKVAAQMAEGQAKGVSGTPGTFVNDEFINGAQPYEAFKAAIDAQLR